MSDVYQVRGLKIHLYGGYTKYIICLAAGCVKKEVTVDSRGGIEFEDVDYFGSLTHRSKRNITVSLHELSFLSSGYTLLSQQKIFIKKEGKLDINMDLFEATGYGYDVKPTWVFMGSSNLGKSFLAREMASLTYYETDSCQYLPDTINVDVVVIGKKYPYSFDEVSSRIRGKVIKVIFS